MSKYWSQTNRHTLHHLHKNDIYFFPFSLYSCVGWMFQNCCCCCCKHCIYKTFIHSFIHSLNRRIIKFTRTWSLLYFSIDWLIDWFDQIQFNRSIFRALWNQFKVSIITTTIFCCCLCWMKNFMMFFVV